MKAYILKEANGFLIEAEVPEPEPEPEEVVVKLEAAALNHRDLWIRKGVYPKMKLPCILGSDGAGSVAKIGSKVKNEWLNREVVINPSMHWGNNNLIQGPNFKILGMPDQGTFAEYICVPESCLNLKPLQLDFREAAALPLAGLTAYRACMIKGRIPEAHNVLITGIGGGVALFALQISIAAGVKVFVTSGHDAKLQRAIEHGATGGVLYTDENWADELLKLCPGGFDLIIDGSGGDNLASLVEIAAPAGRIVIYGQTKGALADLALRTLYTKQLIILGTTMGSEQDFRGLLSFCAAKNIKPIIDQVFSIKSIEKAFERLENAQQFGKIVLSIDF
ncbi:MAG: zinc-binding dehydrogenase [Candidatus Caenarcaniphilales bacterium]|nr:zinc-binding dehydrogenase [Candidatus Caenarcaniphilales bacterium]